MTPKINFKLITSAHFKRRITTTGRKMPEDSAEIIEDFFATCNQQLLGLPREQVFGCDETNFRLDAPSNYTYAEIGATRINATTTGHEMQKVSVMVCASATGFKFPLVIVVPPKTPMKDLTAPDNTIVVYKPSGTFGSSLIAENFLKRYIIIKMLNNNVPF